MQPIIGRKLELEKLKNVLNSKKAEFMAIYGRRRVGKTYLVSNFFGNKGVFFELTGLKNGNLARQLGNFAQSLGNTFYAGADLKRSYSWQQAFEKLTAEFAKISNNKKIILFFDELPWLANKRSGFMQSLDYMWNKYWSRDSRIKLIVCGSAASWMIENLINAKGGLYNRVTSIMLLKPLNLSETNQYLLHNNIKLTERQLLEIYMVMGGIPHYLNQLEKNKSAVQNINNICFKEDGVLFLEFDRIFASLFSHYEQNKLIVLEISKHQQGVSRDKLLNGVGLSSGGGFNRRIAELEASGFIQTFIPYGRDKKDQYFRIVDEYTLFYLRWISQIKEGAKLNLGRSYWQTKVDTPAWFAWAGYAFENVCYKHIPSVLRNLDLDNISCEISSWRQTVKPKSHARGVQIDLIIDRSDDVLMLGEIKFTKDPFAIDKEYALNLKNKIEVFSQYFKTKKNLQLLIITSAGLKRSIWTEDLVNAHITATELIKAQ